MTLRFARRPSEGRHWRAWHSPVPSSRSPPTDDELRAALEVADLPALLPALAHVTGDLSLLRAELRIDPLLMGEDQGGLTPEQQDAASVPSPLETLIAFRDGGSVAAPMPTGADLQEILEFMAGGLPIDDYLPMMREELALTADLRAPHWHKDDVAPDRAVPGRHRRRRHVGHRRRLPPREAGVPYVVIEKNADVGGTWFENTYPGCRVDVPNHYYSYSFAQRDDWPLFYSPRAELHDYFRECVDEFGIRPEHPLRHRGVVGRLRRGDGDVDRRARSTADGDEDTIEANAVISAVGQLNRPQLPEHRGPRELRRPGVPLGALGPRRRPRPASASASSAPAAARRSSSRSSPSRSPTSRSSSARRTGSSPCRTTTTRCPQGFQ